MCYKNITHTAQPDRQMPVNTHTQHNQMEKHTANTHVYLDAFFKFAVRSALLATIENK